VIGPVTPRTVYVFPDPMTNENGRVIVCDKNGKQIPELQGRFEDMKENILSASDKNTEFNGWPDCRWPTKFTKDELAILCEAVE